MIQNKQTLSQWISKHVLFFFFICSFIFSVSHYFLLDRQIHWDECDYLHFASTPTREWTIWEQRVFGYLTFLRFLIGIIGKGYVSFIVLKVLFSFILAFSPIFIFKIFKEFNVSESTAIISTFFSITTPIFLYLSPRFFSGGLAFSFAIIGCYFFISWIKYELKTSLALSVLFFFLTFTFRSPMLILPFGIAIALIFFNVWDISALNLIKKYVPLVIILTILVSPIAINFQFLETSTQWILQHAGRGGEPLYVNIIRVGFTAGLLWPLSLIGFLKRSKLTYMLLIWALICGVPSAIINIGKVLPRYLIAAIPSLSLTSGLGFEQIVNYLQKRNLVNFKVRNSGFISKIQILILIIMFGNFLVTYPRYEIITSDYDLMIKSVNLEYENPVYLIAVEMDLQYLTFVYPDEDIYYVPDPDPAINIEDPRVYRYVDRYLEDKIALFNLVQDNEFFPILYVVRVYRQLNSYNLGWPANDEDIALKYHSTFNTIIIYEVEISSYV